MKNGEKMHFKILEIVGDIMHQFMESGALAPRAITTMQSLWRLAVSRLAWNSPDLKLIESS